MQALTASGDRPNVQVRSPFQNCARGRAVPGPTTDSIRNGMSKPGCGARTLGADKPISAGRQERDQLLAR